MIRNRLLFAFFTSVLGLIIVGCGGGAESSGMQSSGAGGMGSPSMLAVRPADEGLPFQTLPFSQLQGSAISEMRVVTIRDADAWNVLWAEHVGNAIASRPAPKIDFSRNMVVGVFVGSRSSECSAVSINAVKRRQDTAMIEVDYQEFIPGIDVKCPSVITNPVAMAIISASDLPVDFVEKPAKQPDDLVVRSGWSLDSCADKCEAYVEIMNEGATFRETNHLGDTSQNESAIWGAVSPQEWQTLVSNVGTVPTQEGASCPNCAVGDREWIEIENAGGVTRVDFSCNDVIAGAEKFQDTVRAIRGRLALALGLSAACSADNVPLQRVTPAVLTSSIADKRFVTIKNDAAWSALWSEHTAGYEPAPEMPKIDFSTQMVLGVFIGSESSPCGSTSIETVRQRADPDRIEVAYRVVDPGPEVMCIAALLNQYSMVAVPTSSLPVVFIGLP